MNGVIGEQDYDKLMGGLPAVTLGLVAIEGLTNTQAGSSVAINASAPSSGTTFTGTEQNSKNGQQQSRSNQSSSGGNASATPDRRYGLGRQSKKE